MSKDGLEVTIERIKSDIKKRLAKGLAATPKAYKQLGDLIWEHRRPMPDLEMEWREHVGVTEHADYADEDGKYE